MMHKILAPALLGLMMATPALAQQKKDKAIYKDPQPGYYQTTILKQLDDAARKETPKPAPKQVFKIDLTGVDLPTDADKYTKIWHQEPVSQGRTNTCWCFATTSFYESEVYRLTGQKVRLSEMYIVYWEYVERAHYFVQKRGNMFVGEGSENNALAKAYKKYGAVPHDAYTGMKNGLPFHDHATMFREVEAYLKGVKERNEWNEEAVVSTVRSIMDHYVGAPPEKVTVNGKAMTPQQYLDKVLKLNMDDYVNFMSLMQKPFYQQAEYEVPDNWWHADNYNNLPIEDFMTALKGALKGGYTISIGGDVSEPGLESTRQVAVVPTFDIPAEYIDDAARQVRFNTGATTDDHAMHIVGYQEKDGKTWFLVKDSGAGSRNCGEACKTSGYYFFSEEYVKLKMLTMTVHKDAVKEVLKKMNKS